jgi:pimeloyl-ACP methyl ester carboxylesterase
MPTTPRRVVPLLIGCLLTLASAVAAQPAPAAAAERRVPLHTRQVSSQSLFDTVGLDAGIPRVTRPERSLDLTGDRGAIFVRDLRETLGPACDARLDGDALIVRIDRRSARTDPLTLHRTARLLSTGRVERPTIAGDRYGLTLPPKLDPTRPLVLLVHGLDSDNGVWGSMAAALGSDGWQIGYFSYPDDGPVAKSGDLLADCFADLRHSYPELKVDVIAHSMGGLVVRRFVEGPSYFGGVDRIVLLGTPNHGSTWARCRWTLELCQHYQKWQTDPTWTRKRMREDGNGEAGDDLKPGSKLLQQLNARPRAAGVRYTVIAGDQNAVRNVAADWVDCTASCFPTRTTRWWGFRQCHAALARRSAEMRAAHSPADGPVTVDSCRLDGVNDFVVAHTDHVGLACGNPPGAWSVIHDRLHAK